MTKNSINKANDSKMEYACWSMVWNSMLKEEGVPKQTERQQCFLTAVMKVSDETEMTAVVTLWMQMHQQATKCFKDLQWNIR